MAKKPKLVQALQCWQVYSSDLRSGEKTIKLEGKTGKLWRGDKPSQFLMKNYVIGKEDDDGDTATDHFREMIDGHITLLSGCWIIVEGWVDQDQCKEPGKARSEVYDENYLREIWHFNVVVEEK